MIGRNIILLFLLALGISGCSGEQNGFDAANESIMELKVDSAAVIEMKILESVGPNPVIDTLTVRTINSIVEYEYIVTDTNGITIEFGIFGENGGLIDMSDFTPGKYLLKIPATNESMPIEKK